jgi:hypothetical protein
LPDAVFSVPEEQRAERCRISEDLCVLDGEDYFFRCVLELPLHGGDDRYGLGVWSTLSATNFNIYADDFNGPGKADFGPFFGWQANRVPKFDDPFIQKCRVHFHAGKLRSTIELEPTDHPLAIAQRDGITITKALEIASTVPGILFVVE